MQKNTVFPNLLRRLILSWLLAVTLTYWLVPASLRELSETAVLAQMSTLRFCLFAGTGFVAFAVLSRFFVTEKAERWIYAAVFPLYAITALCSSFSWTFLGVCVGIEMLLLLFSLQGWNAQPEPVAVPKHSHPVWLWITVCLSVLFFLLVSVWTVGRIYCFYTPTYDFGIFSQMFYHMKQTGLPMTTVERDGLLSHFAVHVSPIYYLLLPFYLVFPVPATLQILQAAVLTSAVIPLWKLGEHHGLTGAQRMLVCAVLLLYPAFSGGTSYDIHENCFLTPLLLWLFYGIERKNTGITVAAAILTLLVKEDAAVYVAIAGLWPLLRSVLHSQASNRFDWFTGVGLFLLSLGWFLLVTGYLAHLGDGVMTYRYSNFLHGKESSLQHVIKSVLLCPIKAVYECADYEKLSYILLTLLPLLGLPLLTRRYERWILLIPYILVNLMPDYQYQHSIFFQYNFGSIAFLMYLCVVNLAQCRIHWLRMATLLTAVTVSAACFGLVILPSAIQPPVLAMQNRTQYQAVRDILKTIPEDASVTATTFYTTALSQRMTLYDVRYSSKEHLLQSEYVVLNIHAESDFEKYADAGKENGFQNLCILLEENGYALYDTLPDTLVIYRKT